MRRTGCETKPLGRSDKRVDVRTLHPTLQITVEGRLAEDRHDGLPSDPCQNHAGRDPLSHSCRLQDDGSISSGNGW